MSGRNSIIILIALIFIAYFTGWYSVYQKSKLYYHFAEQQYEKGNYVLALKGINKIELYPEDDYFGGYQNVIEAWKNGLFVFYPDFYYQALERSQSILQKSSNKELKDFIYTYIEIDIRYIPEAATCLLSRYKKDNNKEGEHEMTQFLNDAFPAYKWQASPLLINGCQITE
ncbi:hypothetical protein GWI68_09400 [Proteus sp. G2669]|uniref:hypothetical protein n=1 Tax=unclassified Proteus (in: enterobacteria) TaxID=257482 RepID=UPI001AA13F26|nr:MULTISPECIES: hypothetical protein [unclassified Proteus (in: enterobacteria)]NBM54999.1 hypothetical protein [Proteus sp. G2669]UDN35137.1 hypothetical protein LG402_15500 [Proteus sp. NMG38-2]